MLLLLLLLLLLLPVGDGGALVMFGDDGVGDLNNKKIHVFVSLVADIYLYREVKRMAKSPGKNP